MWIYHNLSVLLQLVAYLISCFGLSLTVLSWRSTCLLVSMADFDLATVTWGGRGIAVRHFDMAVVKFVMLKCEILILCLKQWMKEAFLIPILSRNLPPSSILPQPGPPRSCPVQGAKVGEKHTEMKEAWPLTCSINHPPKRDNKICFWNHISIP